jgi:hypothetical protein
VALVLITAMRTIATGLVNIAYIEVGQGDAILLRAPDGFDSRQLCTNYFT